VYLLQLTQRKQTYQLELVYTQLHTRTLVSPRFVLLESARWAYDNVIEHLPKLKEQLLTYNGKMYAQHPSSIIEEVYFNA